jgi:hypothetical protein
LAQNRKHSIQAEGLDLTQQLSFLEKKASDISQREVESQKYFCHESPNPNGICEKMNKLLMMEVMNLLVTLIMIMKDSLYSQSNFGRNLEKKNEN